MDLITYPYIKLDAALAKGTEGMEGLLYGAAVAVGNL